ncbi:MAG: glycosyltransferase [Nanoarchaeota archaeon]
MQKVSIVIPAHNEERRIGATLIAYSKFFNNKLSTFYDFEIIVVLNACKDNTLKIVRENKSSNVRILNFVRGGKGFAVIEGFKESLRRGADIVGFVDADMATPPEAFYQLVSKIRGYDGVIASRYLRGARLVPAPSIGKIFGSRIFNFLLRTLFFIPYRDTQCGAKIFTKRCLLKIMPFLSMSQWAFDVEMLYVAHRENMKILELATSWSEKEFSKIDYLRTGIGMALGITRLRIINSPFKKVIKIYERVFLHKNL